MLYLVTGPEHSGKSARAEALAVFLNPLSRPMAYVATMMPYGEEGIRRVERHRSMRRGKGFLTLEQPVDVETVDLRDLTGEHCPVALLECVINLTANEMFSRRISPEKAEQKIVDAVQALRAQCRHLIVVTGELEPDSSFDEETAIYVKTLSRINQKLEQMADQVIRTDGQEYGTLDGCGRRDEDSLNEDSRGRGDRMPARHGGNVQEISETYGGNRDEWLDFSANINPFGVPEPVKKAVFDAVSAVTRYPDPESRDLARAVAAHHRILPEQVLCGNGAADLIYRITYGIRPRSALLTAPSFLEYEEALKQTGTDIQYYPYSHDTWELGEDFLEWIAPGVDLIFLGNPDNPTGTTANPDLMDRIAARTKDCGAILALDECFLDFVPEGESLSMIRKLEGNPHVLILRSFTKMFAIPGLRLGYLLGSNPQLLNRIRLAGPAWPVNSLAQAAGPAALLEREFVKRTAAAISEEREFLIRELERLGFPTVHGRANYLLFRDIRDEAAEEKLYRELLKHRILIRRCGNYRGLDKGYYRTAVRSHQENLKLLDAICSILNDFSG